MTRILGFLPGLIGAIVAYVALQFTEVIGLTGGWFELLIFLLIYLVLTGVVQAGMSSYGAAR
jgi:hypothetical protein